MQTTPDTAELVTAVREFLETHAAPQLTGHTAFHARVAINALAIVERDLTLGPDAAAREAARLAALTGESGDLAAQNRALCAAIRAGTLSTENADLMTHLRETTLDKVAMDQPRYSGYRDAMAALGRAGT